VFTTITTSAFGSLTITDGLLQSLMTVGPSSHQTVSFAFLSLIHPGEDRVERGVGANA
jgi:hypothetical protein